jgi:hypothetical protein
MQLKKTPYISWFITKQQLRNSHMGKEQRATMELHAVSWQATFPAHQGLS